MSHSFFVATSILDVSEFVNTLVAGLRYIRTSILA